MTQADKPVILVDGSSYLFRAFHALPPLSSSKGQPTGAIKGVTQMLRKLQKDYPGSPIAVVFDAGGKSFRNDMFPAYKANRPPMPDDLRAQIRPTHDIVRAMGLPLVIEPGVEADDVIGTYAKQAEGAGLKVVISTSDKDIAQLVDDHVLLVNTMTETTLDAAGVEEKFGVPPNRIIDLLALMGDTADNIPGVDKVGPKTAAKWLQAYGSLDEVIARADEIKGKIGENLRAALHQLPLSRDLATIRCDLALPTQLADLQPTAPDTEALAALFMEFEFRGWYDELQRKASAVAGAAGTGEGTAALESAQARADYDTVLTLEALQAWAARLRAAGRFAVDTETTSIDYMQAELVGISFAVAPAEAAYVPVSHRYLDAPPQLDCAQVLEVLRPLLEDAQLPKVLQNAKYDMSVLARHGVTLRGVAYDTMLESYVLDSVGSRHNMDDLALNHLGHRTIKFEDVAGKGAKQITFDQVAIETATAYAAEDADITLRLHEVLWPKLDAEPTLLSVFRDIEMPLVPVLSRVERNGALVDARVLRQQSAEIADRLGTLVQQAHEAAGQPFNLDSPKQLQELLYGKLGLPILRRTPGGQPSTAEEVLEELASDYELPRVILEYRGLAKLKSTYTDKLPLQVNAQTGRIHTSYHQAVAATGRLSSSDPNLQNIPIRTAEGRRIRQAFVAPIGSVLLAADYSQIELRIMAHLSGDRGLTGAFERGLDVHRATAGEVFGVPAHDVTDDQRRSAKAINFGLIYGMSAFGLARQIGVSRTQAAEYIERYFERYPGVRAYMESTRERARELGYVETLFGRRLYLPEIRVSNVPRRQAAERTAINAPMQGTAADIIKRAMIAVDRWITQACPEVRMIMQVHDELVFELPEALVPMASEEIRALMSGAAQLAVPLEVQVGTGRNWDEAH
jgi:DNA polymerase-1